MPYFAARGFADVAPADVPVDVLRDFHDTIAVGGLAAAGPARIARSWPVGLA